jgi:LuxR family transcriptional regulator, maltose regulon positive regulatory protein
MVDAGQAMAALLRRALARDICRQYVEHLLAAFPTPAYNVDTQPGAERVDHVASTPATSGAEPSPIIEAVTARELQVLRLLAVGASNAELARELVVEQSTIKTHLIHLYEKLGVHNRTQAVARAHALPPARVNATSSTASSTIRWTRGVTANGMLTA